METNKILTADILDIIFEGKNKEYGAYELRKTYNRRIVTAMIAMAVICLLVFLSQLLGNSGKKEKNQIIVQDVQLEDIKKEEKKPEPPPHHHHPNRSLLKLRLPNLLLLKL